MAGYTATLNQISVLPMGRVSAEVSSPGETSPPSTANEETLLLCRPGSQLSGFVSRVDHLGPSLDLKS